MSIDTATVLPEKVDRPSSAAHVWNQVPLGVSSAGEVVWDVIESPGLLIRSNRRYSGIPSAIRTILAHFAQHASNVRVIAYGEGLDLTPEVEDSGVVVHNGAQDDEGTDREALERIVHEIDARSEALKTQGKTNFQELKEQPYAVIFIVDNLAESVDGTDPLQEDYLARIAQDGARVGVYLILGAHSADDVDLVPDDVLAELSADYNISGVPSYQQPRRGGRAVFGVEGVIPVLMQGYYTSRRAARRGWVGATGHGW